MVVEVEQIHLVINLIPLWPFYNFFFKGCALLLPATNRPVEGGHLGPVGPECPQSGGGDHEHCTGNGNPGALNLIRHFGDGARDPRGHPQRSAPAGVVVQLRRYVRYCELRRLYDVLSGVSVAHPGVDQAWSGCGTVGEGTRWEGLALDARTVRRGPEAESGGAAGQDHYVHWVDHRPRAQVLLLGDGLVIGSRRRW